MSVDVQPTFKVPEALPQDLLLIRDLVGELSVSHATKASSVTKSEAEDDDINSSGSEDDSEDELDEVEANLDVKSEEDDGVSPAKAGVPSDSSSDTDSDSDSESESNGPTDDTTSPEKTFQDEACDEEDSGPQVTTATYFQTKNELADVEIEIPTIEEVGPEEVLEKVGEIMSVVGNVVIVKGMAATSGASERALDSDTLLVFEDRRVLGYIYETFGPTYQPLYQVKFNQKYPLDPEKIQVSCQVFHLPNHSNFVFLSQLKKWKGSDASNVHDEEPADDELEFSDDEEEAAFKSQRKRKRGESRANSIASSRHATPTPSQMRDQDLVEESLGKNAYDERGPYDIDFSSAGPSRPPPVPYDDPYSNEYNAELLDSDAIPDAVTELSDNDHSTSPKRDIERGMGGGRGRGRGRARGGLDRESRRDSGGRGRGRGRGWGDRGHDGRRYGREDEIRRTSQPDEPYEHRPPRPLSPTSLAIARATGQLDGGSTPAFDPRFMQQSPQIPISPGGWQFQQPPMQPQQQFNFGAQQPFVQPHINPRFASQFGMNFGFMQPQFYPQYGQYGFHSNNTGGSQSNWADEWTVHGSDAGASADRDGDRTGDQSNGTS